MRVRRPVAILLLALPFCPAGLSAQVTIRELTELAKARAEKLRPELEKKLAPYIEILSQDYKDNFATIEEKLAEIQKLGDSIIPLLLEKLEPRRESPRSRNLADNCRRILEKMDPSSFVDALIEIAQGENYTGIGMAIPLLGKTGSDRAGDTLTQVLDRLDPAHTRAAMRALTELKHKGAVLKVAKGLPYGNKVDDRVARTYLSTLAAPEVVPEVLRALSEVKRVHDIMSYIRLVGVCARADETAAHALLPYFDNMKLDASYWREIAAVLAVVAPKDDQLTIERLRRIVRSQTPGTFELQAAMTLRTLGDKIGPDALKSTLVRLTKGRPGREYLNWSNLGDFYLEFGDYIRAVSSFKTAISKASNPGVRSMLFINLARAQARRTNRHREVLRALRDSGASYHRLMESAAADPALAEAMKHPSIQKFLDSFPK